MTPKELSEAEIRQTIADFANSAQNVTEAGFDGVVLHGAGDCRIRQFLAHAPTAVADSPTLTV